MLNACAFLIVLCLISLVPFVLGAAVFWAALSDDPWRDRPTLAERVREFFGGW